MIYPSIGISLFAHMIIVGIAKVNNFAGFVKKKVKSAGPIKMTFAKKVLLALSLAVIIESISILVVGSSVAAIDAGFISSKSNINIVENIIKNK